MGFSMWHLPLLLLMRARRAGYLCKLCSSVPFKVP